MQPSTDNERAICTESPPSLRAGPRHAPNAGSGIAGPARRGNRRTPLTQEHLRRIDAFRGLDAQASAEALRLAEGYVYAKGQDIVTHGDGTTDVYFIVEGQVRVNIFSAGGRHITFELLAPGQMFGELSAIDGRTRSASCSAETDVLVARFSASDYRYILRRMPDLAEASLERLAGLVRYLCDKLYESHALHVPKRIRRELLRVASSHQDGANCATIVPAPTDSDLASRIGTTREAVNRQLRELANQGLVQRQADGLQVLDLARLRQTAND